MTAAELVALMAPGPGGSDIQLRQTRFRIALARSWGISPGARVLELGCGQGDTTAVLADAVGADGHVTAVDPADPSYGAPLTLGEATAHLAAGPLGKRITFLLGRPIPAFPDDAFDTLVLAHCTWYFDSLDVLCETLLRARPWARRLCLSEWDLEPASFDQLGHLLAVLIQGQVEAHRERSSANIRTPYAKATLRRLLDETGWRVVSDRAVDSSALDDGGWEIAQSRESALPTADALGLPARQRDLLRSQVEVLEQLAAKNNRRALPSFALVAERASG